MNAEKLLWPIFCSQVGQRVPVEMKLESDMWHNLLDVHTTFQIDISKHVEKGPKNFEKSKRCKNNRQN